MIATIRARLARAERQHQVREPRAVGIGLERIGAAQHGSQSEPTQGAAGRRPLDFEPRRHWRVRCFVQGCRQLRLEADESAADAQAAFSIGLGRHFEHRPPIRLSADRDAGGQRDCRAQRIGVERTAKFKLGTAQRPVARRPRLHLKGSTQNTAPDIGRRHLGAVDIEVAVHIGRRHRRTGPTERHAVQVSVYQHAPMREVLERQK